jgi:hypothetical protein
MYYVPQLLPKNSRSTLAIFAFRRGVGNFQVRVVSVALMYKKIVPLLLLTLVTPAFANSIDRNIIRRIVRKHNQQLQACYQTTLKEIPSANGRIDVKFSIDAKGNVLESHASGFDETLAICVASVFSSMRFPSFPETVTIHYPVVFQAAP